MSLGRTRQSATRLAHLLVTLLFLLSLAPSFVTAQENPGPAAAPLTLLIDAAANRTSISPNIYGMNYPNASLASELKLPLQRWGGNATSRYNYLADISNRGSDWFFENVPEIWGSTPPNLPSGSSVDQFITRGRSSGTKTLMTIPLMGWVARTDSPRDHPLACGFSTAKYGAQAQTDSYSTHCGLGRRADGSLVTGNDPTDTSMAIDPTFVKGWIKHLTSTFGDANNGGVRYYNLDNEPSLWHETHRDIRPTPLGYAELRDRTYAYAAAVKAADPGARTLGPAEWGWNGYFYSARDSHSNNANPDRAAYGNKPLVQWYLEQMRAYEQQHGVRILDYLDLHYYPQASGVALSDAGNATTQARRLRSTRSLWDPNYSDESWIASQPDGPAVRLIPRMRDWVNTYYPGTKLAITEYNWGALDHINGALAQADVLGIFGRENVDMALLWDPPAPTEPGAYAFRMYLNYDGKGSAFGTTSVKATSSDQDRVAVYAATSGSTLTLMVINKGNAAETTTLNLANFTPASSAAVYRYSEANLGAITQEASLSVGSSFSATFPQRSITLLVLNKSGSGQPASSNTVYLPLVIRSPRNQLSENPTPTPTTPTPGPTTPTPGPTTPTPAPKTPTPAPTAPTPKTPTPTPTTPTDPVAGTVRIMPLGDSITEGVNGGYRVGLWNRLVGDGYKLDYVGPRYDQYTKVPDKDHAGTPGFTTGNILSNIDGYMDSYKPQVVTLMIGTNDLAWWTVEGAGPAANRVGQIIDRIHAKSPTTYVVVASIAPMEGTVEPNGMSRATLVKEYNAAIRQQVSTRASAGKRVSFADVNGTLTMGDLYDGVHPTEAAHDKIAQVWYNAVKPLLAKP